MHQSTEQTLRKLSELNLESDSEEEIEVIYVENLTGFEIVEFARYGEIQILEELVKMDLLDRLIDATDSRSNTVLHMASANGHLDTVAFLLTVTKGAPGFIDRLNASKNTALHWACLNGHSDVARLLLDSGANPLIKNDADRCPFDEALQQNHDSILTLIADQMAIKDSENLE